MAPSPYRVREIFDAVMGVPASDRLARLNAMCGDDIELLTEVKSLVVLTLDDGPETEAGCENGAAPASSSRPSEREPSIAPGTVIGNCVVGSILGFGGFAEVYEAEQESPRRRVALKVAIADARPGVLDRFRSEPDTLARLDHPAIARVIEADIWEEGGRHRPYFVMEFVEGGKPISRYVREHNVGLARRLEMFLEIADAVAHAHRKGVIHRDLSTSNILVSREGRVKVIDFGIARLFDDADRTVTQVGIVLGTAASMSPEQISGRTGEIDIRTDVWALGALLYELVCGRPAYDVRNAPMHEARQKILRGSRTPPSELIGRAAHGINPRDLDRIIDRAMAHEIRDRYESVGQLADDVERLLHRAPVSARAGTLSAQVDQLWRRHRGPVVAFLLVGVVMLSLAVFSLWFAARERTQRRALEDQRTQLEAQRAEADAMARIFLNVLEARTAGAPPVPLIETVEAELERYRRNHPGIGSAASRMHEELAAYYASQHRLERTIDHLREAIALNRSVASPNPVKLFALHRRLGDAYLSADEPGRAVLAYQRASGLADHGGEIAAWRRGLLRARSALAHEALGQPGRAHRLAREALAALEAHPDRLGERLTPAEIDGIERLADAP